MAQIAEQRGFADDPEPYNKPVSGAGIDEFGTAWRSPMAPVYRLPNPPAADFDVEDYEIEAEGVMDGIKERASRVATSIKENISSAYGAGKSRVTDAYGKVAETSADLTQRAQRHATYMKEEQPLQLLAIIGGTAFALGVALRVWRSNRDE